MANRFFINGGVNNNWGDTSNWSTTSGGAGGASVPTSTDDVYLDGNSPNCTLNTTNRTCRNLYCTGYANTLAMGTLYLSIAGGNMTLNSTMLITGTSSVGLTFTLGGTITTGGHILQVVLTLGNGLTFTLGDNLSTNSRIRITTTTINSNQINLLDNAQFVVVQNNTICLGSTLINITGDNVSIGADTTSLNTGININITINSSGTVTFRQDSNTGGGAFGFGAKTLTYTSGTLVFNCAYIRMVTGGTATFNMGSQTIPGLLVAVASVIISLTTDLIVTGTLTLNANPVINSNTLYCYGISVVTNGNTTGTTNIVLNGTGTWSNTGTGYIRNNITIDTAGTLTLGTTIRFDTGTLTYLSGTVVSTGNTLITASNVTIDTVGMSFNNIQFTQSGTLTINSLLSISGTLTLGSVDIVIDGTSGFTCGTLSMTTTLTVARSLTLAAGKTYTINTQFTITGATNSFRYTIKSGTPGTKAILTLSNSATQNIGYTNATDIDSNAGQTVYSFNGVITTTFNWNTLIQPKQKSYIYQIN